ncbi:MAG: hypothetical protein JWN70_1341 [Planctomycetaceae bacterium]|nr:hypothetical protein [Planctomycetaceae bacterium]
MTQREWLLIGGGIAAGVAVGAGLPKVLQTFGPVLVESSQRAGSLLSGLAELMAAQIEKAEDLAAQRKANNTEIV